MNSISEPYADLLEELSSLDIYTASKLAREAATASRTVAGYPKVRPSDFGRARDSLQKAIDKHQKTLRLGDSRLIEQFDSVIKSMNASNIRAYAGELFMLRLLQAEIRLLTNDSEGVRALMRPYAERIYTIENDGKFLIRALQLDGIASLNLGETEALAATFLKRFWLVARNWSGYTAKAFFAFAPFIATRSIFDAKNSGDAITRLAKVSVALKRYQQPLVKIVFGFFDRVLLAQTSVIIAKCDVLKNALLGTFGRKDPRVALVTRAQGGIGDIIMMTSGLRALARKQGVPVKFAIDPNFFPIVANNPDVEPIDVFGAPIDVDAYRWRNLTTCPAAQYESRHLPNVRMGRVQLFARRMSVMASALRRNGLRPSLPVSDDVAAFCNDFVAEKRSGERALVGVQPYSRETYKDHPQIAEFIRRLAETYNVLVFHHSMDGVPTGPGIASTGGLPLEKSLALVGSVDVMVTVDSAFLHAAAAHNTPVIALFGPTDGDLFTQHHERKTVIDRRDAFPCIPCWRNEDIPCLLTKQVGISPCVAAIDYERVEAAVKVAVERIPSPAGNSGRGSIRRQWVVEQTKGKISS